MKIELNEQQLQVLNAALVEIPYRVAAPLIQHINQQIQEQLNSESPTRTGNAYPKEKYEP
jgi:hypothetical protein